MGRVRSLKRRVRDDDFIVGYPRISSDYPRIVVLLAEALQTLSLEIYAEKFSGRRSIWWGWRVTLLALHIGNDVTFLTQITDDIHFAWQVQYLLRFEVDFACSAHCKWCFTCDPDQSWDSFCVAGAVFGEVARWLCLLCALEMTFHLWRRSLMTFILRGRCSIWWGAVFGEVRGWLCFVNDVSNVTRINHEIHFAWQAQYLVRLHGDFACSAHCKWRFKCDPPYRSFFFLHGDSWCPCDIILRGGPGSSIYVYYKFRDCAPIKTYRQSTNRSNIWLEKATEGYRNSRVASERCWI